MWNFLLASCFRCDWQKRRLTRPLLLQGRCSQTLLGLDIEQTSLFHTSTWVTLSERHWRMASLWRKPYFRLSSDLKESLRAWVRKLPLSCRMRSWTFVAKGKIARNWQAQNFPVRVNPSKPCKSKWTSRVLHQSLTKRQIRDLKCVN